MANIEVIYNGDKIVMRLIDLDVNYPSDDRVVTYKIINYALNGGAVTINRQTTLPARVTSGAEITLFFDDIPTIELPGGVFEPFEEGSECEIIWTCDTTEGDRLASGSSSIVCQGPQAGIDIAKAIIIPYSNGYAEFTVYVSGTELTDNEGNKGIIRVDFRLNGRTVTVESTLQNASIPNQEMTYFVNAYLPESGDLYATVYIENPDGTSAEKEFYFNFETNLAPVIDSMELAQINAENKEVSVTWNVTAKGNYRWAITAGEVGTEDDWQKATSGTSTIPSGSHTETGITFDKYTRYRITLWVYYDHDNRTYTATQTKLITLSQYPNVSARIEVVRAYGSSLALRIIGLDTGYTGTDRYAVYSISQTPNILAAEDTKTVPLEGGVSTGGGVLFSTAHSTDRYAYYVWCDIYNGDDELIKTLPMIMTTVGGHNVTVTRAFPYLDVLSLEWDCEGSISEIFFEFEDEIYESDFNTGTGDIIASNPTRPPEQRIYNWYYSTQSIGNDCIVFPYLTEGRCRVILTIDPTNYVQRTIYIYFSLVGDTVKPAITEFSATANGLNVDYNALLSDALYFNQYIVYVDGVEYNSYTEGHYDSYTQGTITLPSYGEHIIAIKAVVDGVETNVASVKVYAAQTGRPDKFEWDTPKVQGDTFDLSVTEINRLMDNINAVRAYRGLVSYQFTYVTAGQAFSANMYNNMVAAIKEIEGYGTYLVDVVPGLPIEARHLNLLRDELNAIE